MEWDGISAEPPKPKKKEKKKKEMKESETVVHYAPVEVDNTKLDETLNEIISADQKDRMDGNVVITPANDILSQDMETVKAK